ncbi:PAS domain-containing protein [Novosphingobium panipatense]|uniref:PAS domain-containing protein n=1 Tax=Novosphingobium panipatense TaxID=428991 RepID=UPI003612F61B
MDNPRGDFPGNEGPDEEPVGASSAPKKAAADERRMQVRAYNFWASLLGEKTFPDIADLDPSDLPDFGPRSVLLDFSDGIEDPAIAYVGAMLTQECGATDTIRRLAEVPGDLLLSRITDHYMQILANEAPIGFEAEYVNTRGVTILYRGILMPFSRSGDRIDYIYGVINWKERTTPAGERVPASGPAATEAPVRPRAPEPLAEWADAPLDVSMPEFGPSDYTLPSLDTYTPLELPTPGFAFEAEPAPFDSAMELADWLASARELALLATHCEERSHQALYDAVGRAYDFALAAQSAPGDLDDLIADAGLTVQERAPLLPLMKLVFGADYDKTRLTEFATVVAHGRRIGLERGTLASYLSTTPGGLKALVREERRLRRIEAGTTPADSWERLASDLRTIESRPLTELADQGEEFTVLVARRLPDGEVVLVGEVAGDDALLQRAARTLLDSRTSA